MRDALAELSRFAKLRVGMDLIVVSGETGKGHNVTLGDCPAEGCDFLPDRELFEVKSSHLTP